MAGLYHPRTGQKNRDARDRGGRLIGPGRAVPEEAGVSLGPADLLELSSLPG